MRVICIAAVAALLGGCSALDVVKKQDTLYAPVPITTESPARSIYSLAQAAAKASYKPDAAAPIPAYIDAGITMVEHNCRAWLQAVSMADLRFKQGEANVNVLQALMVGIMGAAGVHHDVFTVFGLGSAAYAGYTENFAASVLFMADYDLQSKVREAMATRAAELRASAATLTYPQAVGAIEAYQEICLPQTAKAMQRGALQVTTTTISPAGSIQSAPVSVAFQKDDSTDRIVRYWLPGNVENAFNRDQLRTWLDSHGFPVAITVFAHGATYAAARQQMINELRIP